MLEGATCSLSELGEGFTESVAFELEGIFKAGSGQSLAHSGDGENVTVVRVHMDRRGWGHMWTLQANLEVCIIGWGTWEAVGPTLIHPLLCHQSYLLMNVSFMMLVPFFKATKPLNHHIVL